MEARRAVCYTFGPLSDTLLSFDALLGVGILP